MLLLLLLLLLLFSIIINIIVLTIVIIIIHRNWWQVAGILTGDAELVGQSLDSDVIIEPVRGPLIPGFAAVKAAAKAAGMPMFLFALSIHGCSVAVSSLQDCRHMCLQSCHVTAKVCITWQSL